VTHANEHQTADVPGAGPASETAKADPPTTTPAADSGNSTSRKGKTGK
jgi:hypothetical protein